LLIILLLAAIIRLILLFAIMIKNPDGIYVHDSYGYWNLGYNLTNSGIFSRSENIPLEPDYYRTPVYPIFIAFAELIGPEGFSIILLQIIIAVLTCYFAHRIAYLLTTNSFISNTAALIVAIDLPSVALTNLVLTETLFTFLLVISFYFFIRYFQTGKTSGLVFTAIFSGLLILCRPIAFFIPFLFSAFILYRSYRDIRNLFKLLIIHFCTVFLTLSPWLIRNKITFNHFFLSVIREHNLLNYQAGAVYAEVSGQPLPRTQSYLRWKTFKEFKGNAHEQPYEYAKFIEKEALSIITDNPAIFLKQQATQVAYFFLKPTRAFFEIQLGNWGKGYNTIPREFKVFHNFWKGTSKIILTLVIFQLSLMTLVYIFFLAGLLYMKKNQLQLPLVLFLFTIICFSLLNLPPATESRFRVPVVPLIAIISSCGFYYFKSIYWPALKLRFKK
ncbi:MAG TPA: glycosyltransferase family 39 protein, partial [Bacteroidia bacterium]|nr:glycosyltransferase family 39 protein [Bacteroidia bacterium]